MSADVILHNEIYGRHPARSILFRDLRDGLRAAKEARLVSEAVGPDGLRLYCYTDACVYDRQWSEITMAARGLILDPVTERLVATPFPKFFNVGERGDPIPDLPFETFEKLDGSLIIIYRHAGEWRTATKGSFGSSQALWAAERLAAYDLSDLDTETTYLAEAVYPENRIVVHYEEPALVMLAAYDGGGAEVPYDALAEAAARIGWRMARRCPFPALSDLLAHTKTLPASEEGFVLRFANGLRLKVKGDEYRRIHALISRVTPLAMWEAMKAGDDMGAIRRDLPEEFWGDFDAITGILDEQILSLVADVRAEAEGVRDLTDKEVGLRLAAFPERVRRFIFPYRKEDGAILLGRTREALFRDLRPTGNRLLGYMPSYAINRALSDE